MFLSSLYEFDLTSDIAYEIVSTFRVCSFAKEGQKNVVWKTWYETGTDFAWENEKIQNFSSKQAIFANRNVKQAVVAPN